MIVLSGGKCHITLPTGWIFAYQTGKNDQTFRPPTNKPRKNRHIADQSWNTGCHILLANAALFERISV
jgi:hypothetical protein